MEVLNRLYFMICLGAVDIVAVVVLIGIAVVLAVLFRQQIEGLLNTLLGTISEKATNAVN